MNIEIGQTIIFSENDYTFYQDFASWENIPTGVKFKIVKIDNNDIWLEAPGYGKKDNYGNGKICVHRSIILSVLKN